MYRLYIGRQRIIELDCDCDCYRLGADPVIVSRLFGTSSAKANKQRHVVPVRLPSVRIQDSLCPPPSPPVPFRPVILGVYAWAVGSGDSWALCLGSRRVVNKAWQEVQWAASLPHCHSVSACGVGFPPQISLCKKEIPHHIKMSANT
jgi:hypothetical protein